YLYLTIPRHLLVIPHLPYTTLFRSDRDLFLPPDPDKTLAAWRACEAFGLDLVCGAEPLDRPRDRLLAERVISSQALVRATDGARSEEHTSELQSRGHLV